MTIARKSMEVGQALPPVQKEVTFENIRLFSMWSNRNIHTDWEIATKGGFPAPIAQGLMSHASLRDAHPILRKELASGRQDRGEVYSIHLTGGCGQGHGSDKGKDKGRRGSQV
jgi:hypothetical protein